MIASSDIDQRLPASRTWLAPVMTAFNPAFSSASGASEVRGGGSDVLESVDLFAILSGPTVAV